MRGICTEIKDSSTQYTHYHPQNPTDGRLCPTLAVRMAPKRKQSKTNWRKRGAEFEEATLTARQGRDQDVRTGGSFSGKADADLFSVDASSSVAAPKRRGDRTSLYVDRVVASNPHVPLVSKARTAGVKERSAADGMKMRKLRKQAVRRSEQPRPKPSARAAAVYDLWGDASAPASTLSEPSQRAVARSRMTRRRGSEVPEAAGGAGALPAVHLPNAGASYNPSREAHQELLGRAVGHELERIRKAEVHRYAAFNGEPLPAEGVGINRVDGEDEEEGEGEGGEEGEGGLHREHDKFTLAKRKRLKRARDLEAEQQAEAAERKRAKQLGRVGALVSELKGEESKLAKRQVAEREAEEKRPRRMGKYKFDSGRPEVHSAARGSWRSTRLSVVHGAVHSAVHGAVHSAWLRVLPCTRHAHAMRVPLHTPRHAPLTAHCPVQVLLTEELPANLRSLPAVPPREGMMNDRYKSLQARNLIEPRKMAGKNKTRKMNSVTKNSAKDLKYTSPHAKWSSSKDTKYTSGMELPSWM